MNDLVQRLRNHIGTAWHNEHDAADEIEKLRAILTECAAALDHISRRGGFSETLGWSEIIKLRDMAANAAGGDDGRDRPT